MSLDPWNILQINTFAQDHIAQSGKICYLNSSLAHNHCVILAFVGNHSRGLRPHPAPYLGTILVELSTLMSRDDALPKGSPNSTGDLGVIARDLHVGLIVVCEEQQMSGPGLWSCTLYFNPSPSTSPYRFGSDPSGQRNLRSTGNPSAYPWRTL